MNSKTIMILGGGVGGQVAANALRRRLPEKHRIVLIEREPRHAFAASFPWVMTGARRANRVTRSVRDLVRPGIEVIHGNTIKAEHASGRTQTHQLTAHCLLTIAKNTGNRCCKRTVFQVLETATNFFQANVGVTLDCTLAARFRCPYSAHNGLCNQEACRYFPIE